MTNEIISSKKITFGESDLSIMIFEDRNVLLTFSGNRAGISCNIHGTHLNLVELRNAISEVLGNGI